jgi:hypothetical protein
VYHGSWQHPVPYGRLGGDWKQTQSVWVRDGGLWKMVYQIEDFS